MTRRPPKTGSTIGDTVRLSLERMADAGAAVGYGDDGRVVFVDGGLPGEKVAATITEDRKRHRRAVLVEVESDPSNQRRDAECPTHAMGCGGCDLAHVSANGQQEAKVAMVVSALERIAKLDEVPPVAFTSVADKHYRTTVRVSVADGKAGYRRRQSHDIVAAASCLVAAPGIAELLQDGRFGNNTDVRLRASLATGERIVMVDLDAADVVVPDDVIVCGPGGRDPLSCALTELVAGRSWRVSAPSFFQSGPAAASLLVETASAMLGDLSGKSLVDAYCGVGLFAGSLGHSARQITGVEVATSSLADARVNLADLPFTAIESDVEHWVPERCDVVIADPARSGLRAAAVDVLASTNCRQLLLVSCDTGSMGRDVGLLTNEGFAVDQVSVLDTFPQTSHVETLVALSR